jgi:hypothetical protein
MSDLIFYTNGKETSRMPAPTLGSLTAGTKCPETKLEIKMTEIEKVKGEIKVLEKKLALLEEMENYKTPVEEAYKDWWGEYPSTNRNDRTLYSNARWEGFQAGYEARECELVKEGLEYSLQELSRGEVKPIDDVIKSVKEELENPKPMDDVVNRLVKKYQAQKLWNIMRDKLGFSIDMCDEIVDLVESWLPQEQSAAGSQNVDTELLVDGHNHCLQKMKEMLR